MTSQRFTGIRRELRKRVPVTSNYGATGFTTVPDGYEEAEIEVEVDFREIAHRLGRRAMENKSGKSKYLDGAVVVRVIDRKRGK